MKKTISLLLTFIMVLSAVFGFSINAYAETLFWPVPGHKPDTSISQGFHDGNAIDISDSSIAGAKVIAALGGTVEYKYTCTQQHYGSLGDCNGFGTGLVIRGTDGRAYQYAHMQANSIPSSVYVGAKVNAGQEIGKVGTTGNSSGNHLHFAISYGNYWEDGVNPLNESYNYSEPSSLGKATNLRVKVTGGFVQLFWDAAPGANCYDVIVTKPDGSVEYMHSSGTAKDFRGLSYGVYKFDVQSLYRPNGSTTGQVVGPHSDVYTFDFNMQSPTNVTVNREGKTITVSWDAADGANCYDVIMTNPNNETNWYHSTTTSKTFTDCAFGRYVFDIQSLYRPNGTSQGQKVGPHSGEVTYDFNLEAPKNVRVSNDENDNLFVQWDAVDLASCYDVIILKPNGQTDYKHSHGTSMTITDYEFGYYEINVQSLYRQNEQTQGQIVGGHSNVVKYNYAQSVHQHTIVIDEAVSPTCTTTGLTEGSHCSTCGEIFEEQTVIPKLEHIYEESIVRNPTCTNTGLLKHTCKLCGDNYTTDIDKTEHDYVGVVTTKVGCVNEGVTTYTCRNCGDNYVITIPATGHTLVTDAAVAATCTQSGLTAGSHCSACGGIIIAQQTVAALGHNYTGVVTAPTCKDGGYTTYICSRCGDSYKSDFTGANGQHTYSDVVTVQPTCIRAGEKTRTCTVCGSVVTESIPAIGHQYSGTVTTPATCTTTGIMTYTCSKCSDSYTASIPAKGHTYISTVVAPTCTEKGYTLKMCTVCGAETKTDYVFATGHKVVIDKAIAPTFSAAGKTEGSHCSVCGAVIKKQSVIAKLGAANLSKVTAGSKQFKASWKKVSGVDGYEIQYSLKSSFSGAKKVTVKGAGSTSKAVKKLKGKKKYYVRIRAYKTINGKKQYSKWSEKKAVTTKK